MIYSLTLPMGIEDVEEVRVLEWHGEPGHQFQAGDLVVELETHKALIEVSAGQAGHPAADIQRRRRVGRTGPPAGDLQR